MQDDLTLVVTGAAGFIGANLVRALNTRGHTRIVAVDDLTDGDKIANLADCEISDYLDKDEFLARLADGDFDDIGAILHQGACSDTMESDGRYMMRNNYRYSVALLDHCQDNDIPFLYASSASVYGGGSVFSEAREHEAPLNVYGYSKFLFDQYRSEGRVKLFEGSGGFGNGEQRRDFVYVDDIVAANLWFLDRSGVSGIFNLGTGRAQSFNDMAAAVVNAIEGRSGAARRDVEELVKTGAIQYVPMPTALVGKYQSFTEADLTALRKAGYTAPFASVEEGAARYVERLMAAG